MDEITINLRSLSEVEQKAILAVLQTAVESVECEVNELAIIQIEEFVPDEDCCF